VRIDNVARLSMTLLYIISDLSFPLWDGTDPMLTLQRVRSVDDFASTPSSGSVPVLPDSRLLFGHLSPV
jgi:hypothetical protein